MNRLIIMLQCASAAFFLATGHVLAAAKELDLGAMIQPVPPGAKFADPDYYIWGGSMVRGDDGKCHLLYSRWPRKLGHNAWVTHSEIAHAVADSPMSEFRHRDVALPARGAQYWDGLCTHNPNVHRFGDKYYLYYMGNTGDGKSTHGLNWTHRNNQRIGVAVADSPAGPWLRMDKPLIDVGAPDAPDALMTSNPSVARGPDGTCLMVYKAVGKKTPLPFGGPVVHMVATSTSPTGPFVKHPVPVFTKEGVHFAAEDPYIWHDGEGFRAIVKDNAGHFTGRGKSTALFESADGLDWKLSKHPLVATTEIEWEGGAKQQLNSLERPQLFFENGRPAVLLFACDEDSKRAHSYNIRIPLKAGQHDRKTAASEVVSHPSILPGGNTAWEPVWSDEFDYPDADLEKQWISQNGPCGHVPCSRWRENCVVSNGMLRLNARKEKRGGQEWTCGSIWTKREFLYGYFECRYKYAAAEATNNSFWLMPTGKVPPGRKHFEIDINEGHYPDKINSNIHNHSDKRVVNGKTTHPTAHKRFTFEDHDFSREFHVFGLEWSDKELIFYLDGKEIRREKNEICDSPAPVWLSLAIVPWGGRITEAIDGTFMEVDYVRVYQKRPAK